MTKDKFKERLLFYRDSFSNDIPMELVHSTDKALGKKSWKVRKGWFTQVALVLELALLDNLIPESLINKVKLELAFIRSQDFKSRLTSKEDIQRLDSLINLLIKAL